MKIKKYIYNSYNMYPICYNFKKNKIGKDNHFII
jgi:hypothetical protein